ncbi:MAG: hypothetical protein RMM53_05065 [Bacteroidia bacterium]|nr:hypothetical protein [Bacteroidia bacterium]MDW8333569.1 hypothetical protein [Bacteroidia bacterium]
MRRIGQAIVWAGILAACGGGKSNQQATGSEAGAETEAELTAWLNEPRAGNLEPQTVKIHPLRYQTVAVGQGAFVFVAPGAVSDPRGLSPNIPVDLRVRSIVNMDDFVRYGMPTETNDAPASFGCAFYFDVRDTSGNTLDVDPNLGLIVAFPVPKNSPLVGAQKKNLVLYRGVTTSENKTGWEAAADFQAEPNYLGGNRKKWESCRALVAAYAVSKTRRSIPFKFGSVDELTTYNFSRAKAGADTLAFFQVGERYFWNKPFNEGAESITLKIGDAETKYYDVGDACKSCAIAMKTAEADPMLKKAVADAKSAEYEYVHMRIAATGWYAVGRPYSGETATVSGTVVKPDGSPANFTLVHWVSPTLRMHLERDIQDGQYKFDVPAGAPFFIFGERGPHACAVVEGRVGQSVPELKLAVVSEADRNRQLQQLTGNK